MLRVEKRKGEIQTVFARPRADISPNEGNVLSIAAETNVLEREAIVER